MSHSVTGQLFPNLEPIVIEPYAEHGKASVAPAVLNKSRNSTDSLFQPVAPVLRSDRQTLKQSTLADYVAKKIVVKEILELLNGDLKDPLAHRRYLETLSYQQLDARREQIREERQLQFKFAPAAQRRIKR